MLVVVLTRSINAKEVLVELHLTFLQAIALSHSLQSNFAAIKILHKRVLCEVNREIVEAAIELREGFIFTTLVNVGDSR